MTDTIDAQSPTGPTAFPMARTCPFDPPPEYASLRETQPISRVAVPGALSAWLVTRHEHVRQLLADPRLSSDRSHPDFPILVPRPPAAERREFAPITKSLIGLDPPEHAPARRMVINEFTVKRVAAMRPRIQQIVDDHIDAMLAGPRPTDLVQALSLPVPSLVICELLGVPYSDRAFFHQRTKVLVSRVSTAEERAASVIELKNYLDELVTAKERELTDDLLGRLIVNNRDTDVFDHERLVGMAFLLLLAGHETTANMISLGTLGLLANPDKLAELTADPALVPPAVEELLRYFTIVDGLPRMALADIEIDGVLIRKGDGVILSLGSANRDRAFVDDPDVLDIRRGARHHVSFAFGIHQCLGQNLARAELETVFHTLFARIPGLRLAKPLSELPFKDDASIYGLHGLPVTW